MKYSFLLLCILISSPVFATEPTIVAEDSLQEDADLSQEVILNGQQATSAQPNIQRSTAKIISINEVENGISLCTGTLIASDVILTAGHCLINYLPARVSFSLSDEIDAVVTREIAKVVVHPKFKIKEGVKFLGLKLKEMNTENDIALIFLKQDLPNTLVPALLPPKSYRLRSNSVGILAGFGMVSPDDDLDFLEKPLQFTVTNLSESSDGLKIKVDGRQNICSGDSGGPVYVNAKDQKVIVLGVHSFANCHDVGYSTKVSNYTDWILKEIKKFRTSKEN